MSFLIKPTKSAVIQPTMPVVRASLSCLYSVSIQLPVYGGSNTPRHLHSESLTLDSQLYRNQSAFIGLSQQLRDCANCRSEAKVASRRNGGGTRVWRLRKNMNLVSYTFSLLLFCLDDIMPSTYEAAFIKTHISILT